MRIKKTRNVLLVALAFALHVGRAAADDPVQDMNLSQPNAVIASCYNGASDVDDDYTSGCFYQVCAVSVYGYSNGSMQEWTVSTSATSDPTVPYVVDSFNYYEPCDPSAFYTELVPLFHNAKHRALCTHGPWCTHRRPHAKQWHLR